MATDSGGLEDEIAGRVVWRGDEDYEAARRRVVWQDRKPARYPEVIVHAKTGEDVKAAVTWARSNKHRVSVRSGGHSWAGSSIRDGGLLVDVGELRDIEINVNKRIAVVGPGVKGRDLNTALRQHGLFFPTGHCPTVALGGFLLAGGYGLWSQHYKQSCFSVHAVDVITADGGLIHASEAENSDYLWAARGAGNGFFGVVVRFYLDLYPWPTDISGLTYVFPRSRMPDVLRWAWQARTHLTSRVEFSVVPTVMPLGSGAEPTPVIIAAALAMGADGSTALSALEPLTKCPLASDALLYEPPTPASIDGLYALADQINPPGRRYAVDNMWTSATAEELLPLFEEAYATLPTPESYLFWYHWNPQELPDAAMSVHAPVWIAAYAVYDDPGQDAENQAWVTELMRRWESHSDGSQSNDENFADRFHRPMSDETLEKLEALRAEHDPDRVFHSFPGQPA